MNDRMPLNVPSLVVTTVNVGGGSGQIVEFHLCLDLALIFDNVSTMIYTQYAPQNTANFQNNELVEKLCHVDDRGGVC